MRKIILFMASMVVSVSALAAETIIVNRDGVSVISSRPTQSHPPMPPPVYGPVYNGRHSERERIKHYMWCESRGFRGRECLIYRNGKKHGHGNGHGYYMPPPPPPRHPHYMPPPPPVYAPHPYEYRR